MTGALSWNRGAPRAPRAPTRQDSSLGHLAETCTRQAFSSPLRPMQEPSGARARQDRPAARALQFGRCGRTPWAVWAQPESPEPPNLPRSSSQHWHARGCKFDHAQDTVVALSGVHSGSGTSAWSSATASIRSLQNMCIQVTFRVCPPSRGARMGWHFRRHRGQGLAKVRQGMQGCWPPSSRHGTLDHGHAVAARHIDPFPHHLPLPLA